MVKETETVSVTLESNLYRRLEEIAKRRNCAVDDLVGESLKVRYSLYTVKERNAAVDSLEKMSLPVGSWDDIEKEITDGATKT